MYAIRSYYANDLTDVELKKLANDFLKEKDPIHKTSYLRFFAKRKFPMDYQPILKIARGRITSYNVCYTKLLRITRTWW